MKDKYKADLCLIDMLDNVLKAMYKAIYNYKRTIIQH